jgi:hypothetical protein
MLIVATADGGAFNDSDSALQTELLIAQRSSSFTALPMAAMTTEYFADKFKRLWERSIVERVLSEVFVGEFLIDRSVL